MTVHQKELGDGVQLVAVTGRLDQRLSPTLNAHLTEVIDAGNVKLIVDLSAVTYINSGGLRALVTAWRKAREQSGNLVICGLNERLLEVFSMVGFDKVFSICSSQEDACELLLADD